MSAAQQRRSLDDLLGDEDELDVPIIGNAGSADGQSGDEAESAQEAVEPSKKSAGPTDAQEPENVGHDQTQDRTGDKRRRRRTGGEKKTVGNSHGDTPEGVPTEKRLAGGMTIGLPGLRAASTQIDPDTQRYWTVNVGNDAGKAAAALREAQGAVDQYVRTVQAARAAGMPERKLLAITARYDIDLPELEPEPEPGPN